jgi:hypothetical protein
MTTRTKQEIARPACSGREDEPAALANARPLLEVEGPTAATPGPFGTSDLLRQAIESGQASPAQVVSHHQAGEYDPARKDSK